MTSSGSDSSDYGERFRNVRRLLIKSRDSQRDQDENYAYKQKLGDLIFNANFEGGNLGEVEQFDQYEYNLKVRPDVSSSRDRIWFNFTVSNQRPNQCVIFNLTNLSETLTLYSEVGLTPVVRSRLKPNWIRLPQNQVFYLRAKGNSDSRRILSIAFRFSSLDDEHQFALFYPYTPSTLDNFLSRWQVHLKRCKLHIERTKLMEYPMGLRVTRSPSSNSKVHHGPSAESRSIRKGSSAKKSITNKRVASPQKTVELTKSKALVTKRSSEVDFIVQFLDRSVLSKPIYKLSVTSNLGFNLEPLDKAQVIVIGRSNGNFESASSWVCQGIIDFVLSNHEVAEVARQLMNLIVFPMLDPDSIWVGNGRTDLMGQQSIDSKMIEANPRLYSNYKRARGEISSICKLNASRSITIIELRVNPNLIGSRIVGFLHADSLRMERHLHLPRLLSRFSDGFYLEKCEFLDAREENGGLLDCISMAQANVESYRLEISPFGYHKRSLVEDQYEEYDQRKYLLLGKSIVYSLLVGQRNRKLPPHLDKYLGSFHQTSRDVDDLMLNQAE